MELPGASQLVARLRRVIASRMVTRRNDAIGLVPIAAPALSRRLPHRHFLGTVPIAPDAGRFSIAFRTIEHRQRQNDQGHKREEDQ